MALAARDPSDRAEQLITLTNRLTELVERETRLFEARRPLEAAPFRDEKAKLANIYRQETARIAREPALIADIDEPLRAELTEATERFHAALAANREILSVLQTLTEGLVRSVAQYVQDKQQAGAGYGPQATPRRNGSGGWIACNQSV